MAQKRENEIAVNVLEVKEESQVDGNKKWGHRTRRTAGVEATYSYNITGD